MLTHFLTSQPALIKLDNENIGGHLTPLQVCQSRQLLTELFQQLPYAVQTDIPLLNEFDSGVWN